MRISSLLIRCGLVLSVLLLSEWSPASAVAQNWPRFRGENGRGISDLKGIPTTWTKDDFTWEITLEHEGHSAPIVWEKCLFVTSASSGGKERFLHCIDADHGKEIWKSTIQLTESPKHLKNSWATSTPATDGERVYTIFADNQSQIVTAWSFSDGQEIWKRDLGEFGKDHGQGVSPVIVGDLLIVSNDQPGPSSIIVLRADNGETVWEAARPSNHTSFSTPLILPGKDGTTQLLCLSQPSGLASFDLQTGQLNWQTPPMPLRTVASLIESRGIAIAYCGQAGNGKYLMAVNTAPDVPTESRIIYERKTQLPYVPTSIAKDDLLFLWGDSGVISCLEIESGQEIWTKRLDNVSFSGSPICIDGRLYGISESGEVCVLKASREFEELGKVSLGEGSHSTPAVGNGHLYLRTFHRMMALPAK